MKRFREFNEQSKPVVELYKKFGKVRWIDASGDIGEVYAQTKLALQPQIFFLIGPKGSGKSSLGKALADRTNMHIVNFSQWLRDAKLKDATDEQITLKLIQ